MHRTSERRQNSSVSKAGAPAQPDVLAVTMRHVLHEELAEDLVPVLPLLLNISSGSGRRGSALALAWSRLAQQEPCPRS